MSDGLSDIPRQKLREIIHTHGRSVCNDRTRCKGLLLDYCGRYQAEINVLITVLEENVPTEFMNVSSHIPSYMLLSRLTQRVCSNRKLDKDAARWGVESWALALGVEVKEIRENTASQQKTHPLTSPQTPSNTVVYPQPPPPPTRATPSPKTPVSNPYNTVPPPPTDPYNTRPFPYNITPSSSSSDPYLTKPLYPSSDPYLTKPLYPASDPYNTAPSYQTTPSPTTRPPTASGQTQTWDQPSLTPRRRTSFVSLLPSIFLIAVSFVIVALSARTSVYIRFLSPTLTNTLVLSPTLMNTLLPFGLCVTGALLRGKRAFWAMLLYLGLGAIGLPLFLGTGTPTAYPGSFLFFFPARGGIAPLSSFYYFTCPVIAGIVGQMCEHDYYFNTFWRTLGIVLVGHVVFEIFVLLTNIFTLHYTITHSLGLLLPTELGNLVLVFAAAIVVRIINAVQEYYW